MDEQGGVHCKPDDEFARNTASALSSLQSSRYNAVLSIVRAALANTLVALCHGPSTWAAPAAARGFPSQGARASSRSWVVRSSGDGRTEGEAQHGVHMRPGARKRNLSFGMIKPIMNANLCRLHLGKGLALKSLLRIGLALGLFILLVPPTEAAGSRKYCEPQVNQRLALLKVDPSDIAEITYEARRHPGRDDDQIVRILAWVNQHSCKGYVIIDLSQQCTVRQIYGRDGCNVVRSDRTSGGGC